MSSFIEAIKQSGTDSLDVIMKNGRVYRYVGIDADHLGYLLEAYEEKLSLEESIGRFYNENIKGIYEAIEVTELLEVRTDVDVEKAMATLKEGKALLIGDKEKLDELLILYAHFHSLLGIYWWQSNNRTTETVSRQCDHSYWHTSATTDTYC